MGSSSICSPALRVALFAKPTLERERMLQICDDVFRLLDADRQTYHAGPRAGLDLLGVGQLPMRRRRRMDDERAGVADIGEMRKQPDVRHQLDAGIVAALEPEGE